MSIYWMLPMKCTFFPSIEISDGSKTYQSSLKNIIPLIYYCSKLA
jgi:hypothetical protein